MVEALVLLIWGIMVVVIGTWSIVLDYRYSIYNGDMAKYFMYDYTPIVWLIFSLLWPIGLLFCFGIIIVKGTPGRKIVTFIINKFYKDKL